MLTEDFQNQIVELLKTEVTPAVGCTEPIAVALAVAKLTSLLENTPQHINVFLSPNVLKNAMGVGIPGTGMSGLPIAIALGAVIAQPDLELELLANVNQIQIEKAKLLIQEKFFNISVKENALDKLYIQVIGTYNDNTAEVIISKDHTRYSYLRINDTIIHNSSDVVLTDKTDSSLALNFNNVCDFAINTSLEKIKFIKKTVDLNKAAAIESLKGSYGHSVAHTLANGMMGNTVYTRMLSTTAAACDARMAGAMFPVMSNSGSGNQGIAATLPVSVFAEESGKSDEELIRALTLSHLMTIYIKQKLGKLSGLCGAVVAATGASCGITYLMGGSREQIGFSIKNMIGNITGIICDGAKPSCALKVSNGVSSATLSALLAMDNKVVSDLEGIVDTDIDQTIDNLTDIGRDAMNETDKMILNIMTHK